MHDSANPRLPVSPRQTQNTRRWKVMVLFGTRPEAIKLAPVIHTLNGRGLDTIVVSSSQHTHLLRPFLRSLKIRVDHDLRVMKKDQSPNEVCSRVVAKVDKILVTERPDLVLIQGDTTTALAGALAGFNRGIAVGHVEAGLRSGNPMSPFPEEMNRRLISQVAKFHFAATEQNRRSLLAEKVPADRIFVTGNPVVDSLRAMLKNLKPTQKIRQLLDSTYGKKRLLLTTHRRESFGPAMTANLRVIRDFVKCHSDVCLLFPVHPNPNVRAATTAILGCADNVHLLDPLDYSDFLALQKASWLIVSDSGGVQEEAPSMGKPLLVIRENTERPEAIAAGVAKLVGASSTKLRLLLEENYASDNWVRSVKKIANPFGDGHAAERIASVIGQSFASKYEREQQLLAA